MSKYEHDQPHIKSFSSKCWIIYHKWPVGTTILKPDTYRMLLKSDATYHNWFVLPGYNNVNRGQPNIYFRNKSTLTNITVSLGQRAVYVSEMAKENDIVKFLKMIVLYSRNKKHRPSCQIYVNEPTVALG